MLTQSILVLALVASSDAEVVPAAETTPVAAPEAAPEPEPEPAAATPLPKTSRPRVAIMDLAKAEGVSDDLVVGLTGLIAARIDGLRIFDVVTEDDVRNLINFDELRTVLGEEEGASQLENIGKTLGADFLVSGRAYSEARVDLVLYDLKTQLAVRREVAQAKTRGGLTRPLLRKVDRVIAPVLASRTSRLIVRAAEEGATISVDGDVIGTTPLPLRDVPAGPHTIAAVKEGFVKTEVDLILQPGQAVPVEIVLVPSQEFVAEHERNAWVWRGTSYGLLGGAAASVIGGAAFLVVNEVRTEEFARASDQGAAAVLRLRPAEYGELLLYRVSGGILLAGVAPLLAAGGAFAYLAGPVPGQYDELTAAAE